MTNASQNGLDKIKRVSGMLRIWCKVLAVVTAVSTLLGCVGLAVGGDVTLRIFDTQIPAAGLTGTTRAMLAGLLLLSTGVVFAALLQLHRLFSIYAGGDIFTPPAAASIRRFGIAVVLWAGVSTAWDAVRVLISAGSPLLVHLRVDVAAVGVVIIVLSWFMQAAAELQEESNLTI